MKKQFEQIIAMKWRPKFGRALHPKRNMMKSWKAYGSKDKRNPVFEVGVTKGNVFSNYYPTVEVTKYHAGGIGSTWDLDLEAVDKLVLMLLTARGLLVKNKDKKNGPLTLAEAESKYLRECEGK